MVLTQSSAHHQLLVLHVRRLDVHYLSVRHVSLADHRLALLGQVRLSAHPTDDLHEPALLDAFEKVQGQSVDAHSQSGIANQINRVIQRRQGDNLLDDSGLQEAAVDSGYLQGTQKVIVAHVLVHDLDRLLLLEQAGALLPHRILRMRV